MYYIVETNEEGTRSPQPTPRPKIFSLPNSKPISVTDIDTNDILCGADFDGSTHEGNVAYLRATKNCMAEYESLDSQESFKKESLIYKIVHELSDDGGRFLKLKRGGKWLKNETGIVGGDFELLTKAEAREKVARDIQREYIAATDITNKDVYCGCEYARSEHPGNIAYLDVIKEYKGSQRGKVVNELLRRGIRFVKKASDGTFFLLTEKEIRDKVGQALRRR